MTSCTTDTKLIISKLTEILGPEGILVSPGEPYDRDSSPYTVTPEVVALPETTEQVQAIVRLANTLSFAIIPRGAGTGTAGGCLPLNGGVVVSLERMKRIITLDTESLYAHVEAGVITKELRDTAAARGLFFPPDPASLETSTLGGNVATNAGGPACVKYGVIRDYVLGVEAVLPDGEIINAGVRTRKGVVGYDMAHLLTGSEGTLGIITSMYLKLVPMPPATVGVAAVFPSLPDAMRTVAAVLGRGHLPSALEFLDHKCLRLVGDKLPFRIADETASLLIIELDGRPEAITPEIETVAAICTEHGATNLMPGGTAEERETIWNVRREVSTRIREHAARSFSEDVVVPIGSIADFIAEVPSFEQKYALDIFAFGHAGDGNIHLILTVPRNLPEDAPAPLMDEGIEAVARRVLALGGTISGEHGVGEAKKHLLPLEIGPASLRLQRGIKALFDPNNIMNPDKVFPAR
ncbi:FAD-binding oxidoreductase [Oleidesulfovibrio sp.]|uniref:FAD-binding oxidoreductase n=1 Tax=Oleidesulfovibrio sp. TaxID=2909707 RepID=UPI003A87DC7E